MNSFFEKSEYVHDVFPEYVCLIYLLTFFSAPFWQGNSHASNSLRLFRDLLG